VVYLGTDAALHRLVTVNSPTHANPAESESELGACAFQYANLQRCKLEPVKHEGGIKVGCLLDALLLNKHQGSLRVASLGTTNVALQGCTSTRDSAPRRSFETVPLPFRSYSNPLHCRRQRMVDPSSPRTPSPEYSTVGDTIDRNLSLSLSKFRLQFQRAFAKWFCSTSAEQLFDELGSWL
jgi:hypothetical protein